MTSNDSDPGDWEERGERLAAESLATGHATGWFDRHYLEGDRGEVTMPWNREGANALLARWAEERPPPGPGQHRQ